MEDDGWQLPLDGTLVIDFSQFLAGPVAALRLADLGARVVKVERPLSGEIGRTLAFAGRTADGDTLSFHAMNRNKEGLTADLKDHGDLARVRELVRQADVVIQNFRPGVMERIGLDYASVRAINPGIVYASASGYGDRGPWRRRPGQDLLAQSVSGLAWQNGSGDRPVPVGLSLADHLLSCHLAQGVVALLVRRCRTGQGGLVECSLLEAMLDLQCDPLTEVLNDGHCSAAKRTRGARLFRTSDRFIAVAFDDWRRVAQAVGASEEAAPPEVDVLFRSRTADDWAGVLSAAGLECAPVLEIEELLRHETFRLLRMTQTVVRSGELSQDGRPLRLTTTRSPIRLDGRTLTSDRPAPRLGQDNFLWTASGRLAER